MVERNEYAWSISERVPYFLEENNGLDTGRKDEETTKCEISINGHNSEGKEGRMCNGRTRPLDYYDARIPIE
ncbi:MAG: hypothetical protein WBA22_05765 [Candidatus Methanofastidiosia archaeon]